MSNILNIFFIIFVLAISMSLHEVAHAAVAYILGDNTAKDEGRLSINPIDHIDPYTTVLLPLLLYIVNGPILAAAKPIPINKNKIKWGEFGVAIVAFAGPLMNLVLAFVGVVLLRVFGVSGEFVTQFMISFIGVNISLFVFNLLPIPPLDGSKVLYAIAPEFVRDIFTKIEPIGAYILIFLLILSPIGQIISSYNRIVLQFLLGIL